MLLLFIFPRKQVLTFHVNCVQWRLGKFSQNRIIRLVNENNVVSLLSKFRLHKTGSKTVQKMQNCLEIFSLVFCFIERSPENVIPYTRTV